MWFLLAFLGSLAESMRTFYVKRALFVANEITVAWAGILFSLPFLYLAFFIDGIPHTKNDFWWIAIVNSALEILALWCYMKSLKHSPLSLVAPFAALTPLFLIITSFFMLDEIPTFFGFFGIIFITIGSYYMSLSLDNKTHKSNLLSLFKNKGVLYMLSTAFIWSITSAMHKMGMEASSPFMWAAVVRTIMCIGMIPFMFSGFSSNIRDVRNSIWFFILIGLGYALVDFFILSAMQFTLAVYAISIKRLSVVVNVVLGSLLLNETHFQKRLFASVLILIGALLISLF